MQGVWVQSLVWELRSHMPPGKKNNKTLKKKKRWDNVTNSIKTLKMVHIKKKMKKKKRAEGTESGSGNI